MFTTQHYNAVARILHDSREYAQNNDHVPYDYWYDQVYTPFVKLFEADNPRFHTVSFCYAVASGEYVGHRVGEEYWDKDYLRRGEA